jgi:hypothetical protein
MIRFASRMLREDEHRTLRVVRCGGDILILEDRKR